MTDSHASYFATYDGQELPCSLAPTMLGTQVRLYRSEPAEGFDDTGEGRFVRSVPIEECDVVGYRDEVCTWNGELALVISDDVDTLLLEYAEGDGPKARELGYEQVDRGVFRTTVGAREIRDRHRRVRLIAQAPLPTDPDGATT